MHTATLSEESLAASHLVMMDRVHGRREAAVQPSGQNTTRCLQESSCFGLISCDLHTKPMPASKLMGQLRVLVVCIVQVVYLVLERQFPLLILL